MDLALSRWVYTIETRQKKGHEFNEMQHESLINNNEVNYEEDSSTQDNDSVKFAMCFLSANIETKDLIASLPHDVQALVILTGNTGLNKNATGELLEFPVPNSFMS